MHIHMYKFFQEDITCIRLNTKNTTEERVSSSEVTSILAS